MVRKMKNILLQFDFKQTSDEDSVVFTNPIYMITANKLDEVEFCMDQIERAVQDGYYVAGYFSYEVAYSFYDVDIKHQNESMPLLSFGVFSSPTSIPRSEIFGEYHVTNWNMKVTKDDYEKSFQRVMEAIENGVTKQVNYTVPFEASFTGNSYQYYQDLKNAQQSLYSAYLRFEDMDILSVSPELFFHYKEDTIKVRPMKGTVKRGKTFEEDQQHYTYLRSSEKDRYENKLITTLMTKELEQVAEKDSIHVTEAFTVEKYPTVYQMTSTIVGKVSDSITVTELFKRLFPCGSISGTPKKATLQLIANVEPYPRHVYCGAIGYFSPNNEAIFNVPIRTVVIDQQNGIATYGAGGAITGKSTVEGEYEEVHTKTSVLTYREPPFELIETIGLQDGKWLYLNEHKERLQDSATYFDFALSLDKLDTILQQYEEKYPTGLFRLRCLFHPNGNITHEIFPLKAMNNAKVVLASSNIDSNNPFLFHKTTNRSFYEAFQQDDYFDTLLWNEHGEITEFTIGNVVIEVDGEKFTPPVTSGLLNGTFRRGLVRDGIVKEKVLFKEDITSADAIWFINSVREWIKVELVINN